MTRIRIGDAIMPSTKGKMIRGRSTNVNANSAMAADPVANLCSLSSLKP